MPEPKQKLQLTVGHWITIGGFAMAILSTWFGITAHIKDDSIHLTEQQRDNLTKFTTIVDDKLPIIETNENRIIAIEKDFAVFKSNFTFIASELEGLENKVSRNQEKSERNFVELNNKIDD